MRSRLSTAVLLAAFALVPPTARAWAGTWQAAFAPDYCVAVGVTPPVLTTVSSGGAPPKPAYSFAPASATEQLACEVTFPQAISANQIGVHLTAQSSDTNTAKNVCWQAAYEVTAPGASWQANAAAQATAVTVLVPISASPNVDIGSDQTITAFDQLNNQDCDITGGTSTNCSGYHGLLILTRIQTGSCANDSASAALLTHVRLTAPTP